MDQLGSTLCKGLKSLADKVAKSKVCDTLRADLWHKMFTTQLIGRAWRS